jgi:hypothetical protein
MIPTRKILLSALLLTGLPLAWTGCAGGGEVDGSTTVVYGGGPWFGDGAWVDGGGRGWYHGNDRGAYVHPGAGARPEAHASAPAPAHAEAHASPGGGHDEHR